MKTSLFFSIMLSLLLLGWQTGLGQITEYRQLDNLNLPDGSINMIETEQGNFVSVGYWENEGWMAKFNPCGAIIWMKRYDRGMGRTLLWDVMEMENGDLIAVGHTDAAQSIPNVANVPVALLLRTDACGNLRYEQQIALPTDGLPLPLALLTPTAGYGLAPTASGGVIITGQNFAVEITNLNPVEADVRKTIYLYEFDSLLTPLQYTNFPNVPQTDSLVAYDVITLPDGYAVSGTYYDQVNDSAYIFAAKTDLQLQQQWLERWFPAPDELFLGGSPVNWSVYHTSTSLDTNALGNLLLGGTRYRNPFDFLDPFVAIVDPLQGNLIQERSFPNLGVDLVFRVKAFDQGVLLGGAMTFFDGIDWTVASAVWETDISLNPAGLFTYTDSSDYFFLNTSIIPLSQLNGNQHAFSGLRYLPGLGQDTSASIIFVNSTAQDALPSTPLYYGGVIVQIEDVNIRDTILCRPVGGPNGCLVSSRGPAIAPVLGRAYPTPASETVLLEWNGPSPLGAFIQVFSSDGRHLSSQTVLPGSQRLSLRVVDWPVGLYVVKGWDRQAWRIMKE